jgi:alginate O-acetyltransferase complex protein AlgI
MLFNSYAFILVFLPVVLAGFYLTNARSRIAAIVWLGFASLFFYAWWDWRFLPLLLASILFNFYAGILLTRIDGAKQARMRKLVAIVAVGANLGALAYFKYANFFVDNLNLVLAEPLQVAHVLLPIGISFFTFTQIAFLVDVYKKEVHEPRLSSYLLFVTYYPHLIAGPILHHKEMMPQFEHSGLRSHGANAAVGISIFVIGLFKKVVIADGISPFADPVFAAPGQGIEPMLLEAWCGALAYTFQLYFDFSGYSDMAVGLSRMLGIRLPINFNSPYKATSIIDFWRRWHMTLSRFLRDYLYIPLGGNRHGPVRRYANLLTTMLLGGMWHGAGWTFIVWGGLHGVYLVINTVWRELRGGANSARSAFGLWCARITTFLAVVVAWVFFRAENFHSATTILKGMIGLNGVGLPEDYAMLLGPLAPWLTSAGVTFQPSMPLYFGLAELGWIAVSLAIVWFLPNTQEIMQRYRPALNVVRRRIPRRFTWRPTLGYAVVIAVLAIGAFLSLSRPSSFLYFQF